MDRRAIVGLVIIVLTLLQVWFLLLKRKSKPITDKTVWTYWHSPIPPAIVRRCIKNWRVVGGCDDVRVLNMFNAYKYVPLAQMSKFNALTKNEANKSDLIRFYLLERYGGTWIDGSVFMTTKLDSWLPENKFFCFNARRFSKNGRVCLENFFIRSPKGHPFLTRWRRQTEKDFADPNFKENSAEYRAIIGKNADYLRPYVSSMKLDKSGIHYEAAEDGPYFDTVKIGWKNPKELCQNISYSTKLVKLFNATRKVCSPRVVPLKQTFVDYSPKGVYDRFKDRFTAKGEGVGSVDMLYCICMPQRRDYATRALEHFGQKYKMLDAITPKDLSPEDYENLSESLNSRNRWLYKKMTKLPVCLSFFMCYFDAFQNGHETIAVVEDDIKFTVSMDRIFAAIEEFKRIDARVLFLGYCWANCAKMRREGAQLSENLYKVPKSVQLLCNHALVMKSSFIKEYMTRHEVTYWRHRNDHTLSDYLRDHGIKKVVTPKAYVVQNREELGSNNENYDNGGSACNLQRD